VKSSKEGKTLPEYIDDRVRILKSKNADSANKLLLKLQAIGFNDATRIRFRSTWKTPSEDDTCFYLIEEDSPTNWWSNKDVEPQKPEEILVNKYRLDLSTKAFEAKPLKDLLD